MTTYRQFAPVVPCWTTPDGPLEWCIIAEESVDVGVRGDAVVFECAIWVYSQTYLLLLQASQGVLSSLFEHYTRKVNMRSWRLRWKDAYFDFQSSTPATRNLSSWLFGRYRVFRMTRELSKHSGRHLHEFGEGEGMRSLYNHGRYLLGMVAHKPRWLRANPSV